MIRSFSFLVLGLLSTAYAQSFEARKWKSADGKKTVEANFKSVQADVVTLIKNGKEITFKLSLLSKDDQKWIENHKPVEVNREWTSVQTGKKVRGEYVTSAKGVVVIRKGFKELHVKISTLSDADREWINKNAAKIKTQQRSHAMSGKGKLPKGSSRFSEPLFLSNNIHHNEPHTVSFADTDGDGLGDLMVADYDGEVTYFKNEGTKDLPKFTKGKKLLHLEHW